MYNQTRHLIKNICTWIALGRDTDEVIQLDNKEMDNIPNAFILEYRNGSFIQTDEIKHIEEHELLYNITSQRNISNIELSIK